MLKSVNQISEYTLNHLSREPLGMFIPLGEIGIIHLGIEKILTMNTAGSSIEIPNSEEKTSIQLGEGKMITWLEGRIKVAQEEMVLIGVRWIIRGRDTEMLKTMLEVIWCRTELIVPGCIGKIRLVTRWLRGLCVSARGFGQPQSLPISE